MFTTFDRIYKRWDKDYFLYISFHFRHCVIIWIVNYISIITAIEIESANVSNVNHDNSNMLSR